MIEAIWDSVIYGNKLQLGQLPGFYHLIAWKSYPKKENTWEPSSAVQHLKKMFIAFDKNHPEKSIATFLLINSVPLIARLTVKPMAQSISKQKRGCLAKNATK